jgi:hypothetical protein
MLIFRDKVDRSLETLASCRQRGGRFGRGSVPVARGSLQNDHHRACRSCPRAAESQSKPCPKDSGGPGSAKFLKSSCWSPARQQFLIIARLRRSLASTPNIRSLRCMVIFHDQIDRSLETPESTSWSPKRQKFLIFQQNNKVARDAGKLPTAGWQVWPRERTRCKGQAPKRCCERPLAVDHHRACRSQENLQWPPAHGCDPSACKREHNHESEPSRINVNTITRMRAFGLHQSRQLRGCEPSAYESEHSYEDASFLLTNVTTVTKM